MTVNQVSLLYHTFLIGGQLDIIDIILQFVILATSSDRNLIAGQHACIGHRGPSHMDMAHIATEYPTFLLLDN